MILSVLLFVCLHLRVHRCTTAVLVYFSSNWLTWKMQPKTMTEVPKIKDQNMMILRYGLFSLFHQDRKPGAQSLNALWFFASCWQQFGNLWEYLENNRFEKDAWITQAHQYQMPTQWTICGIVHIANGPKYKYITYNNKSDAHRLIDFISWQKRWACQIYL